MYDRRYDGKVLAFEPSGGLMNAALVMRDRETDSWWSIMTGNAIGGSLAGTALEELAVGEKTRWGDWKARHPNTKVLSVAGKEHDEGDPYGQYFRSDRGFRGLSSPDKRLPDKASIYAFQLGNVAYAVPHKAIEGGAVFGLEGGEEVFLYRAPGSDVLASTVAYLTDRQGGSSRFEKKNGTWRDALTGVELAAKDAFRTGQGGGKELARLGGFDTFWYIWSTTHDGVMILE